MPLGCCNKKFLGTQCLHLLVIFLAELLGTSILVFLGCMSLLVWNENVGINHWVPTVVFAFAVSTIVQMIGHISSAHVNPSVTLCFYILGHINLIQVAVYFFAEIIGGLLGFGLLKLITPTDIYDLSMNYTGGKVCINYPHGSVTNMQAFGAEFLATSILILVVCSVNDPRNKDKLDSAALKFGTTILLLVLAEGPYTGTSINPARSFAPAVWIGFWDKHWIFWVAPLSAGLLASILYVKVFGVKQAPPVNYPELFEPTVVDPRSARRINRRRTAEESNLKRTADGP